MYFLAGAALISAALVLVFVARGRINRPGAPRWLQAAVLGNGLALFATTLIASGAAAVLQGTANRADAAGLVMALAALALPFVGFWLALRRAGKAADAAVSPPSTSGDRPRPRRGRTAPRPANAAGAVTLSERTG